MKPLRYLTIALLCSTVSIAQASDVVVDTSTGSTVSLNGNSLLITPSGVITASPAVSLLAGTAGIALSNEGTLNGSVFVSGGTLTGAIINRGLINGTDATINIRASGQVNGGIVNYGTIKTEAASSHAIALRANSALTGGILNYGLIENSGPTNSPVLSGIRINSPANFSGGITNYGTIRSIPGSGITNTGTIDQISNYGSIIGGYAGIYNPGGTITTLNNAQGSANPSGALIFNGTLPSNYNVVINHQTYGQLIGQSLSGSTRFGVTSQTLVSPGNYVSVLEGFSTNNLDPSSLTGTYGRQKWQLTDSNNDQSWDLFIAPDPVNTSLAIANSASQLLDSMNLQQAALIAVLGYDSNVFGPYNVSISAAVRGTSVGGNANEGAGAIIAAYRFNSNFRLGVFLDYAPWQNQPSGIEAGAIQPNWGGFAVYEQKDDGTGFQARASIARGGSELTLTRSATFEGTEIGRGKANLMGWGAAGEFGYGFRINTQFVATPFLGLRYTDIERSNYSEWLGTHTVSPLTYNSVAQQLTTGVAGIRVNAALTTSMSGFVMIGAEYDFGHNLDRLSGTSAIEGLETFSVSISNNTNRLRATGAAGLSVQPAANQKISAEIGVYQQAYTNNTAVTGLVKYSVGF